VSETSRTLTDVAGYLRARGFSARVQGDSQRTVRRAVQDSRACSEQSLFIALPGDKVDGAKFISAALASGAAAALCSNEAAADNPGADLIVVDDVLRSAGHAVTYLCGEAAAAMTLVAVTGTNGKTSCTYLLESVWKAAGIRSGVIGTVSTRWPGAERTAAMTTPALVDLHAILAEMHGAGCGAAVLEVSSHALDQHRVSGCTFDVGIFTNLTRDHLDYHGDEASYLRAKALLFEEYVDAGGACVVNADDPVCARMCEAAGSRRTLTYTSASADADVRVSVDHADLDGMRLSLSARGTTTALTTRLIGAPNVSNIAAVCAAAIALGIDRATIAEGIAAAAPVPGRLERVGRSRPAVLVDYAHTPDALERTLATVRDLVAGGRLISVFGCGGDRDRGKRPMMGRASGRLADVTVLTSDNPRSESPEAILAEIEAGTREHANAAGPDTLASATACYIVEPDRERAIALALAAADEDDVVVVAGKGHEDYQEIQGVRRHFDDREVVRALQGAREG